MRTACGEQFRLAGRTGLGSAGRAGLKHHVASAKKVVQESKGHLQCFRNFGEHAIGYGRFRSQVGSGIVTWLIAGPYT